MTKETKRKKNERTTVLSRVEDMSIKTKKRREDISNSTSQKDETTVPRRPSIISSESVSV